MNQRRMAARLALLVGLAGVAPVVLVGVAALEIFRRRTEAAATSGLEALAHQVAERVEGFVAAEKQAVHALASSVALDPDAPASRRLMEEVGLDNPAIGGVTILDLRGREPRPVRLGPERWQALERGQDAASDAYPASDGTPRMDFCVPLRGRPDQVLCAQLDLLELSRFVQRIRIGGGGHALALGAGGQVVASGSGAYRAASLRGEDVPHSEPVRRAYREGAPLPGRLAGADGSEVLAGWARAADPPWTVVVEQPEVEALRAARLARYWLAALVLAALVASMAVGVLASRRMLAELAVEERWRTAGRIASGVSHDLGHRIAVLQHTAALAEAGDPALLPRIGASLRSEAETLRRFVSDFADLSRDLAVLDERPLELGPFAESLARSAAPRAAQAEVALSAEPGIGGPWVQADRHLLERAGMNLLANAIEASPRGGTVRIEIGTSDGEAFLRVADGGPGIPAERLPRIFDAFASTKRSGDHLGMGLPNVKRIVEAHGGRVAAWNRPRGGAVIEIRLPRADRSRPADPSGPADPSTP